MDWQGKATSLLITSETHTKKDRRQSNSLPWDTLSVHCECIFLSLASGEAALAYRKAG